MLLLVMLQEEEDAETEAEREQDNEVLVVLHRPKQSLTSPQPFTCLHSLDWILHCLSFLFQLFVSLSAVETKSLHGDR
jgi:hypothetical protein